MENTSSLAEAIPMVSTIVFAVFPVIFAVAKVISIMPRLSVLFFVVVVVISVLITAYEFFNSNDEKIFSTSTNTHTDKVQVVNWDDIQIPQEELSLTTVKEYRKDIQQSESGGGISPNNC